MNARNRIVAALVCAVGLFSVVSAQFDDDYFGSSDGSFPSFESGGDAPAAPAPASSGSASPASWSMGGAGGNIINVPGSAATISQAMVSARTGDTVKVAPGVYRERVIMAPGVALVSTALFGAKIDGGGKGTVVTMARGSGISGFEIRNGTIGIFSSDAGNDIVSNRIIRNHMTGIVTVRHLPKIEDNVIAFNGGSGIQGWDVRSTAATVNHNSIAYNGNHGIAVGGSSEFIIETNVIACNVRFGLKILQEPDKIQVSTNNFWKNLSRPGEPLPANNFAFDPAFLGPRSDLNFKPDPGQCCKEKSANDENLGARLTY
jgi:hypothetical protein